ncbi:hypothetical protein OF001_U20266 [Pseudomonas sp. OF001]|nr:hypothetical protein OF001_U20266 [Pseudomonas sp. OF001]
MFSSLDRICRHIAHFHPFPKVEMTYSAHTFAQIGHFSINLFV